MPDKITKETPTMSNESLFWIMAPTPCITIEAVLLGFREVRDPPK